MGIWWSLIGWFVEWSLARCFVVEGATGVAAGPCTAHGVPFARSTQSDRGSKPICHGNPRLALASCPSPARARCSAIKERAGSRKLGHSSSREEVNDGEGLEPTRQCPAVCLRLLHSNLYFGLRTALERLQETNAMHRYSSSSKTLASAARTRAQHQTSARTNGLKRRMIHAENNLLRI